MNKKNYLVVLSEEEVKAIISALDYQDYEFRTYDDDNDTTCRDVKEKLEKLIYNNEVMKN